MYVINGTWLRRHPLYSLNYIVVSFFSSSKLKDYKFLKFNIGNFVVLNLVPMVVLVVLNYLVYKIVARSVLEDINKKEKYKYNVLSAPHYQICILKDRLKWKNSIL